MKILATSDLHGNRAWYNWLLREARKYDVVVIAGDLLDMFGDVYDQIGFLGEWFNRFSKTSVPLLTCCGNHDLNQHALARPFQPKDEAGGSVNDFVVKACRYERWMEALAEKYPLVVVSGVTKAFPQLGNAIVTSLRYSADGVQRPTKLLEEGAALRRKGSPAPPWIVIHHVPPLGKLGSEGFSDSSVNDWIEEYQPKMVFCGHDHLSPFESRTCYKRIGLTYVFNVGHIPNREYPCHVVIDTATMIHRWVK